MQIFDELSWLEWTGVVFTLFYNFLLMRENIWCWMFGALSSVCAILVYYQSRLYGQCILNSYYLMMSGYGWWYWKQAQQQQLHVSKWSPDKHVVALGAGTLLSLLAWVAFKSLTDSRQPFFDATLTVFCFIATYKEARKILSSWIYWMILNAALAWLNWQHQLNGYFLLGLVYTLLSVIGYSEWRKIYLRYNRPPL